MPKKQKPRLVRNDPLPDTCKLCGCTFDWRYGGVANALKESFCGPRCCHDNYQNERVWEEMLRRARNG